MVAIADERAEARHGRKPVAATCRLRLGPLLADYDVHVSTEIAIAAVEEARLLLGTEGGKEEIGDALHLALRVLRGERVSESDLDALHPAVAHRLRDQGYP